MILSYFKNVERVFLIFIVILFNVSACCGKTINFDSSCFAKICFCSDFAVICAKDLHLLPITHKLRLLSYACIRDTGPLHKVGGVLQLLDFFLTLRTPYKITLEGFRNYSLQWNRLSPCHRGVAEPFYIREILISFL